MLLGGGRALLLQVGHPVVAAGVGEFSDFEQAPWQRLEGTLDLYLRVVYGGREETPEEAGERLRSLHTRIKGVDADGNRYHALDPPAFHWVHATLLESTVEMNARFARRPMTLVEKELLYEEMCEVAKLYGLRERDMPPDWTAFEEYFEEMVATELRDSDTLQGVIRSVFRPSKPPVLPIPDQLWGLASWPGAELIRLTTVGTLPPILRERLGLPWGRDKELALRAQQEAIRRLFPLLPERLRLMPPVFAARRGETRLAA
jgi:uncharacterized protein (DUF2236 family)